MGHLNLKGGIMNQRFRTLIVGGAVVAFSAVAFAPISYVSAQTTSQQATPKPGMHRRGGMGAPLISIALRHQAELNLSSDQVANLEKIRSNYQAQVTPVVQQLRGIEQQIHTLGQQTPANLVQIKSLIQQAEPIRSELRYLRVEALENGKSVLNTQQKDQLKTLLASMHQNFRNSRPQGQAS